MDGRSSSSSSTAIPVMRLGGGGGGSGGESRKCLRVPVKCAYCSPQLAKVAARRHGDRETLSARNTRPAPVAGHSAVPIYSTSPPPPIRSPATIRRRDVGTGEPESRGGDRRTFGPDSEIKTSPVQFCAFLHEHRCCLATRFTELRLFDGF